ncbi:MAG TPA: thymidine phosphorylase [Clostridiales bacterium]|nr:thymidine phosphorylase [Clostridiales bacterium]
MKITDIIEKKKQGRPLAAEEIDFFIEGYVKGALPDYQIAALLMAVYFQGMNEEETLALTMAMKNSGDVLDLSFLGQTIDKHSTGGIGDKLSLAVIPLWRAGGLTVAKMSGRGLGFTGGTVDKLASVPGFNTDLNQAAFFEQAQKNGVVVTGQSASLVPADKKLYALRDVTATVDSLPLIAASVMSKKLATGASIIILDVKYGRGSFMRTKEEAKNLAELMVKLGRRDGRRMAALLSPMDHPLGYAVGNALEVQEVYGFLKGEIGGALRENALALGGLGFYLGGKAPSLAEGVALCAQLIADGRGKRAFLAWLKGQGGCFETEHFLDAVTYPAGEALIFAERDGVVTDIDAMKIGLAAMALGAGRQKLNDAIDLGAGILLRKAVGDTVQSGDVLAVLYTNKDAVAAITMVKQAIRIGSPGTEAKAEEIEIYSEEKWECYRTDI